jgi:hypothetical protein
MRDPKDDENGDFLDCMMVADLDLFDLRAVSDCPTKARLRLVAASADPNPGLKVATGPDFSVESDA